MIPGERPEELLVIAAQARTKVDEPNGYIFVHCKVTGGGGKSYLGRSWFPNARVVFAYSDLGDGVNPEAWSNNGKPEDSK